MSGGEVTINYNKLKRMWCNHTTLHILGNCNLTTWHNITTLYFLFFLSFLFFLTNT